MTLTIERSFRPARWPQKPPAPSMRGSADAGSPAAYSGGGGEGVEGRVPRVTRLMALAIKFEEYVREGLVADYAELARLGYVSRARITQIMDLNLLAPNLQEAVLALPHTFRGRDPIRERHVRPIAAEPDWAEQRKRWRKLCAEAYGEIGACDVGAGR